MISGDDDDDVGRSMFVEKRRAVLVRFLCHDVLVVNDFVVVAVAVVMMDIIQSIYIWLFCFVLGLLNRDRERQEEPSIAKIVTTVHSPITTTHHEQYKDNQDTTKTQQKSSCLTSDIENDI